MGIGQKYDFIFAETNYLQNKAPPLALSTAPPLALSIAPPLALSIDIACTHGQFTYLPFIHSLDFVVCKAQAL